MLPEQLATDGSELDDLPFVAGESPFRAKGTTFTGHLEYVAKHVPGGLEAMNRAMAARYGAEDAAFFEQPFLSASWYDVFPLARAGVVCGELTGMSYRQFLAVRARSAAAGQVRGVYRWFLKLVSAEAIAVRVPKVIDTFFDFGEVEVPSSDSKHVALIVHGIPAPLAPWYVGVSQAYFEHILEITGTPRPEIRWGYEWEGRSGKVELVRLPAKIRWP